MKQIQVLSHIRNFYVHLFANKDNTLALENLPTNTVRDNNLGDPITTFELASVLKKNQKNDKSPGIDSISFLDKVETFYHQWIEHLLRKANCQQLYISVSLPTFQKGLKIKNLSKTRDLYLYYL